MPDASVGDPWLRPGLTAVVLLAILGACSPDEQIDPYGSTSGSTPPTGTEAPGELTLRVGEREGVGPTVFGKVSGFDVDQAGRIAISDELQHRVTVVAADGQVLAAFGRRGSGPGEFLFPGPVQFRGADLLVVDNFRLQVSLFRREAEQYTWAEDFTTGFHAYDACVLGNTLYLLGLRGGATLHAYSDGGVHLRSFGAPYHLVPRFASHVARGILVCDAARSMVIEVGGWIPTIRAYRTTGELLWRVDTIPGGFGAVAVADGPTPGSVMFPPPAGRRASDQMTSAFLKDGSLYVQFGELLYGVEDIEDVTTVRMELDDGGAEVSDEFAVRIDRVIDDRAFVREVRPFPVLSVFRLP